MEAYINDKRFDFINKVVPITTKDYNIIRSKNITVNKIRQMQIELKHINLLFENPIIPIEVCFEYLYIHQELEYLDENDMYDISSHSKVTCDFIEKNINIDWCWRCLTRSQSIIFIVGHDIDQINISSAGMKKMSQSNSIAITISSISDYRQIRIS